MNENLDLIEILKDCPEKTKLYSPALGEVEFVKIVYEDGYYPIKVIGEKGNASFTSKGKLFNIEQGECILFPSKEQRDWSKFTAPWYNLEKQSEDKKEINNFDVLPGLYKCIHRMFDGTPDGRLLFEIGNVYKCLSKHNRAEFEVSYGHSVYLEDPVVCKYFIPFESKGEQASSQTNERAWLYLIADVLTWKDGIGQYLDDPRVQELAKRLCSEYAQKLYNPSSKFKLKKERFDPKTLKPFDKILVRRGNENYDVWFPDFVNDPPDDTINKTFCMCIMENILMAIPYNDDTKHLVGTSDKAPEFYRYWED